MTFRELQETLGKKGSRGSKMRCHVLTSGSPADVAARLTELVGASGGKVTAEDEWMPRGLVDLKEAQLDKHRQFVGDDASGELRAWWLVSTRKATTPNWDIAATFRLAADAQPGLLLVEAKAHAEELGDAGKSSPSSSQESEANHDRIAQAIEQANAGLNQVMPGFALSRDSYYQVSNRFAWAWKIATLGIPVVLVYLGFLRAEEMASPSRTLFEDAAQWERTLKHHCQSVVPDSAWSRRIQIADAWIFPTIIATEVQVPL